VETKQKAREKSGSEGNETPGIRCGGRYTKQLKKRICGSTRGGTATRVHSLRVRFQERKRKTATHEKMAGVVGWGRREEEGPKKEARQFFLKKLKPSGQTRKRQAGTGLKSKIWKKIVNVWV